MRFVQLLFIYFGYTFDKTNALNRQITDLNVEKQRLEEEITRITRESQEIIDNLEEENEKYKMLMNN